MTTFNSQIASLAAAIDLDRLARARDEPMEQKILDGEQLFRLATQFAVAGIQGDHPEWSEFEVLCEFKRRLSLQASLERRHVD